MIRSGKRTWLALAFTFSTLAVAPLLAQELPTLDKKTAEEVLPKKSYSPYVDRGYPTRVYWADTHLHTSQSFDSVMFGNRLGPEEAYRLARREEVTSSTGHSPIA